MRVWNGKFWEKVTAYEPVGAHFKLHYFGPELGLFVAFTDQEFVATETKHGKED